MDQVEIEERRTQQLASAKKKVGYTSRYIYREANR